MNVTQRPNRRLMHVAQYPEPNAKRFCPSVRSSTASDSSGAARTFQVTHPFHPWKGRRFTLVTCRQTWGEDRVYFYDEQQRLISLPTRWTDVSPSDPLRIIADGKSAFRAQDLLELVRLLRQIDESRGPAGGENV